MPTDKPQLTVALPEDDYQWLQREAVRAGISKSGVLRQALSLYQATGGLLGPMRLQVAGQVYADAGKQTDDEDDEDDEEDENSNHGLESFKTEQ